MPPLRYFLLLVGLFGAFGLLGIQTCNSQRSSPRPAGVKIAMLLPGSIRDHGWCQAGYEGLQALRRTQNAQVSHAETWTPATHALTFRRFAGQGAQLVIGFGIELIPAAEQVAPEFPRTNFAVVGTYPGNNRNLGGLTFRHGEISYLAGTVAALKSRTGHVAMVAGLASETVQNLAATYALGARRIRPDIRVSTRYVGNWNDAERARQLTRSLLDEGADVVLVNVNSAGPALKEVEQAGAHAIGWSNDQHALAPKAVLTSGVMHTSVLLAHASDLVRRGRWEGKLYKLGLREKATELAPFRGALTPEQAHQVQAIASDFRFGRLTLEND